MPTAVADCQPAACLSVEGSPTQAKLLDLPSYQAESLKTSKSISLLDICEGRKILLMYVPTAVFSLVQCRNVGCKCRQATIEASDCAQYSG